MDAFKDLKNIRRLITKFNKLKYWEKFSQSNPFYLSLENNNITILFTDTINEDTFGMYFIYNKEGYSFLYNQLLKTKNNIMNFYSFEGITLEVVLKSDLTIEDKKILHSQGLKSCNVNTFLGFNKPGKIIQGLTNKQIHMVSSCISYLDAALTKYLSDISNCFLENKQVVIKAHEASKKLDLAFDNLFNTSFKLSLKPIYEDYYYKFKNASFVNEGICCYSNYLPVIYNKTRPLFLLFYFKESRTLILNICLDNKEEVAFQTFERAVAQRDLPIQATFNNIDIFCSMKNTLSALNIEANLSLDSNFDSYFNMISSSILDSLHNDLEINQNNIEEFMNNLEAIFYNLIISDDRAYSDSLYKKLIM